MIIMTIIIVRIIMKIIMGMKGIVRSASLILCVAGLATVTLNCGKQAPTTKLNTVHIPQSPVGKQSTGNCWAFGYTGWLEALRIRQVGGESLENAWTFSESYLTYRYFEEQLMIPRTVRSKKLDSVRASGDWYTFKRLLKKNGVIRDAHFLDKQGELVPETRQGVAFAALNNELKTESVSAWINDLQLPLPERHARVRALLDTAFDVQLSALEKDILKTTDLDMGLAADGSSRMTLETVLDSWTLVDWKSESGSGTSAQLPYADTEHSPEQIALLKRVKKSLNQGYPIVMNWFADFHARDNNGVFSLELLKEKGPGHQGPHSTVIADYTAQGTDPSTGVSFQTTLGDAAPELKALAGEYGEVESIFIKNSWGTDPTGSQALHGSFGYHLLLKNYLFAHVLTKDESTGEIVGTATVLRSFLVPKID